VELITVKELAAILRVPVSWIYERTAKGSGSIPHVRFGKYIRFDSKEVIDFFKSKEKLGER